MNNPNTPITPLDIAREIDTIYADFIASVEALGSKVKDKKRSSKLAGSFAHWIGGSHVTTDREALCEKLVVDVEKQIETLVMVLEASSPEEASEAAKCACDRMFVPIPAKSDATTDLMQRALIGKAKPLLAFLSPDDRHTYADQMSRAYSRWHRLPIEKEMIDLLSD